MSKVTIRRATDVLVSVARTLEQANREYCIAREELNSSRKWVRTVERQLADAAAKLRSEEAKSKVGALKE